MAEISTKTSQAAVIKWFGPLLDALRQLGGSGRPREVVDRVAKNLGVPDELLKETNKNGYSRFSNQVEWARQYLVWEGLIENKTFGFWVLSQIGMNTYLSEIEASKVFYKWNNVIRKKKFDQGKNVNEEIEKSTIVDVIEHNVILNDFNLHQTDNSSSINEIDGVEIEIEDLKPFDPEKISIDSKTFSLEYCLTRLLKGTINLSPDFQRNEVWTEDKKCGLIESLMLKIPIPMFYVAADEKGVLSVVDGLQRLSTFRDFILGEKFLKTKDERCRGEGFILKDLEFWGEKYNNRNFNSLPANMQNRILETQFTFTIINPGTPEEVKRNIFKRINTGGEPLKAQEIRHALYSGKSTDLLLKLSKCNEFLNATSESVKFKRMMDRELILRFLAFAIRDYSNYPSNNDMDSFLCDTMRIINIMPEMIPKESKFPTEEFKKQVIIKDINKIEKLFTIAMFRSKAIFVEHTFRKSYFGKNKSPINKSLFEVWSVLLSKLSENEYLVLLKNKQDFLMQYENILNDALFINSISRDSWKFLPGVKYRYETLLKLLNKYIHD